MKIIYMCGGDVSVYESQVLELLTYLQASGIDVTLLQGYKNAADKSSAMAKMQKHDSLKVVWFKTKPCYSFMERSQEKIIYNALVSIPDFNKAVIHVRSEHLGHIVKQMFVKYHLSIPMLIDIRGLVYEERKYSKTRKSGIRKILNSIQIRYFAKFYTKLFTNDTMPIVLSSVSPLINEYITAHYPSCSYPKVFHPNIAGRQFVFTAEGRAEIRRKYGFHDNDIVVICASNGGSIWQKDSLIIEHMLRKGYKVINLSPVPFDAKGCITTKIPFIDMPKYLSAADIAVLWRDDTFMNNSASPSKFSEFASMGLYVVHNSSVSVATKFISENNAGVLCKEPAAVSDAINEELVRNHRQERYIAGQNTFSVENLGQSYIETYRRLCVN